MSGYGFQMILMNMKRLPLALAIAITCLISCREMPIESYKGGTTLEIIPQVSDGLFMTKSSLASQDGNIDNYNVYVYESEALVWEGFEESGHSVKAALSSGRTYNVYCVANVGRRHAPDRERDLSAESYAMAGTSLGVAGVPMTSGSPVSVSCVGESASVEIPMTRLAARLNFRIDTSDLMYGRFAVTSVRLRQAAGRIGIFQSGNTADNLSVVDGDYASSDDLDALNSGREARFYMLENLQGNLLPGNDDPWQKEYGNALLGNKRNCCTYLEVDGGYTDNTGALKAAHKYRMYLGADALTNFDIVRNTSYTLTLKVSDLGVFRESWKVGRDVMSDTRQLWFNPSEVTVPAGGSASVLLAKVPENIDCYLEWDGASFSLAGIGDPVLNGDVVTISSIAVPDEDKTLTLRALTFDRQLVAECDVHVCAETLEPLVLEWYNDAPYYVAQAGVLHCMNVYGTSVLEAVSSDVAVARVSSSGMDVRVEAIREGSATITVTRTDGSNVSSKSVRVDVHPVYMRTSGTAFRAYVDGARNAICIDPGSEEEWKLCYDVPRSQFDEDLYRELLRPSYSARRRDSGTIGAGFLLDEDNLKVSDWGGDILAVAGEYELSIAPAADIYAESTAALSRRVVIVSPLAGTSGFQGENRYYMPDAADSICISGGSAVRVGDYSCLKVSVSDAWNEFHEGGRNVSCRFSPGMDDGVELYASYADIASAFTAVHRFRGPQFKAFACITNAVSGSSASLPLGTCELYLDFAVTGRLGRWSGSNPCDEDGDYYIVPSLYSEKFSSGMVSLTQTGDFGENNPPYHIPQVCLTDMPGDINLMGGPVRLSEAWTGSLRPWFADWQMNDRLSGNKCLNLTKILYYRLDLGDDMFDEDFYISLEDRVGDWFHYKYGWHLYDPYLRVPVPDGGYYDILTRGDVQCWFRIYDYAQPIDDDFTDCSSGW